MKLRMPTDRKKMFNRMFELGFVLFIVGTVLAVLPLPSLVIWLSFAMFTAGSGIILTVFIFE